MSISPRRVSSFHVADVLISSAMLAMAGACYNAPSSAPRPAVVEVPRLRHQPQHFPGVDIVPTGHSAFVIQIHSGMVGDGEPLYVIDGAPIDIPPNRGIDWFKPEDIVQIKVLKYPAELTVYGPRGVNGVIVITTKQATGRSREL